MPKFDPLPIPKFDQSLLSYLNQSFLRLKSTIAEIDANLSYKSGYAEVGGNTPEGGASSGVWSDLATLGPQITLKTGSKVVVFYGAQHLWDGTSVTNWMMMALAVSGATTRAASDSEAMYLFDIQTLGGNITFMYFAEIAGLTPGMNTFTAKYKAGVVGNKWLRRKMLIVPTK